MFTLILLVFHYSNESSRRHRFLFVSSLMYLKCLEQHLCIMDIQVFVGSRVNELPLHAHIFPSSQPPTNLFPLRLPVSCMSSPSSSCSSIFSLPVPLHPASGHILSALPLNSLLSSSQRPQPWPWFSHLSFLPGLPNWLLPNNHLLLFLPSVPVAKTSF